MIEHTFTLKAPLQRIDSVYILEAQPDLLQDRGSVRIALSIRDHSFRSYAFRHRAMAACVVPAQQVAELNLGIDEVIQFTVTVRWPDLIKNLPQDLSAALSAAGARLDALHVRDQRQVLHLIQEASQQEIRQQRIATVVAACLAADREREQAEEEQNV